MLRKARSFMSSLENFKATQLGRKLQPIVEGKQNIQAMITLSGHDIPAVQAIGKQVLLLGPEVKEDWVKQTIGRWVREVLEAAGYVPARSGRVASGNLFSTGMIYEPRTKK
jgi:hypothetical protein